MKALIYSILSLGFVLVPMASFADSYRFSLGGRLISILHSDGTFTEFIGDDLPDGYYRVKYVIRHDGSQGDYEARRAFAYVDEFGDSNKFEYSGGTLSCIHHSDGTKTMYYFDASGTFSHTRLAETEQNVSLEDELHK